MGVLESEGCWYKSSPSPICDPSPFFCVFFKVVQACVSVYSKQQKECVLVTLRCRGLITPQDGSAASGDLSGGGTLLPRKCGFLSL